MKSYVITAQNNIRSAIKERVFKGSVEQVSFDFAPWAEDNNLTLTGVTYSVKAGQASVSNQALSSNVSTADITFGDQGRNIIEITATDGTNIKKAFYDVLVVDPDNSFLSDYGH